MKQVIPKEEENSPTQLPNLVEPEESPPKRRRQHKRSRLGCERCRALKKKCDEQKPKCGRCMQMNGSIVCEYLPPLRASDRRKFHPYTSEPRMAPPGVPEPFPQALRAPIPSSLPSEQAGLQREAVHPMSRPLDPMRPHMAMLHDSNGLPVPPSMSAVPQISPLSHHRPRPTTISHQQPAPLETFHSPLHSEEFSNSSVPPSSLFSGIETPSPGQIQISDQYGSNSNVFPWAPAAVYWENPFLGLGMQAAAASSWKTNPEVPPIPKRDQNYGQIAENAMANEPLLAEMFFHGMAGSSQGIESVNKWSNLASQESFYPPEPAQEARFTELDQNLEPVKQSPAERKQDEVPSTKTIIPRPSLLPSVSPLFRGTYGPRILPNGSDTELISYFKHIAMKIVTAIPDETESSLRASFLSMMPLTKGTTLAASAYRHALLGVSEVHAHAFSKAARLQTGEYGDEIPDFIRRSKEHRTLALSCMSTVAQNLKDKINANTVALLPSEKSDLQLITACMMLLVVLSVLSGDSKLVPPLLQTAAPYIKYTCSNAPSYSAMNYAVLHSIYSVCNSIVRGTPIHPDELLWNIGDQKISDELTMKILGVTKEFFNYFGAIHSSIVRYQKVSSMLHAYEELPSQACREDPEVLRWELMTLHSHLETMELELSNLETFQKRWVHPEHPARVHAGLEIFRAATRVYILRSVQKVPTDDARVQSCVRLTVEATNLIPVGGEVGTSWPLIIIGCEAMGEDRNLLFQFLKRCLWRGTAPPRTVEHVWMNAWNYHIPWQDTLRDGGFKLIL